MVKTIPPTAVDVEWRAAPGRTVTAPVNRLLAMPEPPVMPVRRAAAPLAAHQANFVAFTAEEAARRLSRHPILIIASLRLLLSPPAYLGAPYAQAIETSNATSNR
jgi:hypothetical protein